VFDEIPHSEKVFKRHQNSDDPCIMAWDHYSSPKFYEERKISGTSEKLLCLIQRDLRAHLTFLIIVHDPVNGTWERLPPIDDPLFARITTWSQCVAVN
jgi:hypothetical protein